MSTFVDDYLEDFHAPEVGDAYAGWVVSQGFARHPDDIRRLATKLLSLADFADQQAALRSAAPLPSEG